MCTFEKWLIAYCVAAIMGLFYITIIYSNKKPLVVDLVKDCDIKQYEINNSDGNKVITIVCKK